MRTLPLLAVVLLLPSLALAENPVSGKLPEIDHMVYLTFLPEADDLMADAKANGLAILRLDKTADRVIVTYKYPDGHTATLGYGLLGSDRGNDRIRDRRADDKSTVVVEREPEVIYVERPYRERVIYRDTRDDFWLPLTIGLGIGYLSGHHHYSPRYYYGGGWHGHYRGRR